MTSDSQDPTRWLFAYFTGEDVGGEAVRFARSGDTALDWEILAGGRPVLVSDVGTRGVRDPFLLRSRGLPGESARFYLLATDLRISGGGPHAWDRSLVSGSRSIVVWESDDLVTWSQPRLADVAPDGAGNAWAPEAVYDPDRRAYLVFWASRVRPHTENRMWASTTTDFRTFSEPQLWQDDPRSLIDATVVRDDEGLWWRFAKDESADGSARSKFVIAETADSLAGPWTPRASGLGSLGDDGHPPMMHSEGPIILHDRGQWILLLDEYGQRGYLPFVASSPAGPWRPTRWSRAPEGARHGSVLRLDGAEWDRLATI